jgi:muramoyltetrapeptide carboxypeptidase
MDPSRRRFFAKASWAAAASVTIASPVLARQATTREARPAPEQRTARPIVRPARLRPGDTVGIVGPGFAVWEPVDVDIAVESLAALGLKAKPAANLLRRRGYFAGTDEQRASDLNAMFADPAVSGIHCLRGGWGSARLLPLLDWSAIAAHPKVFLGYSDITALLLPLHARTGLVTFHGPVGASHWNPFNVGYMKRVLIDAEAVTFANPREIGENLTVVDDRVQTITPGVARGTLLGGNLTVLTSIIGSGYLPDFDGCVLFVEDIEEAPYRIDRMLTQLALSGILGKARAVIFGTCRDCKPGEGFGSLTITDVLDDHVRRLGVPAWQGAMIGHMDKQFTLPVGAQVEVDATAGTIRMLEPAVV